ncbi:hypothetical protein SS50377_21276 [Spironucleus salmonicida]|uniref:Uncharacterized protein n=1 Tax=Spironucleus salmonicida TaxID=348837 RepID=V6LTC7_9EUKA|nr:hypothetical protein SS50377_21276 [Spironucleus salmonicida]|eukprot:EST44044.1 Hypothetical protein SS50377_16356 [Spironucleus salmonicida]
MRAVNQQKYPIPPKDISSYRYQLLEDKFQFEQLREPNVVVEEHVIQIQIKELKQHNQELQSQMCQLEKINDIQEQFNSQQSIDILKYKKQIADLSRQLLEQEITSQKVEAGFQAQIEMYNAKLIHQQHKLIEEGQNQIKIYQLLEQNQNQKIEIQRLNIHIKNDSLYINDLTDTNQVLTEQYSQQQIKFQCFQQSHDQKLSTIKTELAQFYDAMSKNSQ